MTLPGSTVAIEDTSPPPAALTNTGTAFVVGLADRGVLTGQQLETDVITSLGEFITRHGARQSYNGPEYDTVEAFFADGGSRLYYSRYAGPAAAKAQITVPSSSPQGTVLAKSEGAWANGGTITISGGVVTVVAGGVTEVSPVLATVQALDDWAQNSSTLIDYTPSVAGTTALTDSAARTLAGGGDDRSNATDTQRQAAIDRFGKDLGPGSVALPGDTRSQAHTILATHARDTNRFAEADGPDSATASTVAAAGTAVRALGRELARHIRISEPWLIAPGTTAGSTRTIPPCGVMMGLAARSDAINANPNRAVAGRNGISRFAIGVKYSRTDADRETLANAGVTEFRQIRGFVQAYDDVTPVDPATDPEWLGAAGNRFVMRVIADALAIADAHMFGSTAGSVDINAFGDDLRAMLTRWWLPPARALYGDTPADAFRVETGASVNTPTTLAARQLRAALALKIAPNARQVVIEITNTPLTGTL